MILKTRGGLFINPPLVIYIVWINQIPIASFIAAIVSSAFATASA